MAVNVRLQEALHHSFPYPNCTRLLFKGWYILSAKENPFSFDPYNFSVKACTVRVRVMALSTPPCSWQLSSYSKSFMLFFFFGQGRTCPCFPGSSVGCQVLSSNIFAQISLLHHRTHLVPLFWPQACRLLEALDTLIPSLLASTSRSFLPSSPKGLKISYRSRSWIEHWFLAFQTENRQGAYLKTQRGGL